MSLVRRGPMMDAMPGAKRGLPVGVGTLAVAAGCGLLAAKLLVSPAPSGEGLVEVGAIGADLRYWRAKEALRHGELRLGVQAQATQALEARATAILGWSVVGVLALGAAAVNGAHPIAAGTTALCLIGAAALCIIAVVTRDWAGPGYRPEIVLEDRSRSELEAIESMVIGYQQAVQTNHDGFQHFQILLKWALGCVVAAPVVGAVSIAVSWWLVLPIQV
ncbi:MAG: hypothetical protein ACREF1_14220 [Acetobacteraceae bacterium]